MKVSPHAKVATVAMVATSIEWYDFFLYATAAALVFPALFFPADMPPALALLSAFATFAVAFIARPLGGILFGHYGDLYGRKPALIVALVMMGAATTLMGCLPSYASIGGASTVMLIILRFIQGLALGGQWGGAILLATESAPLKQRGFYGSFAQIGIPFGLVFANLIFLVISANVSQEAFMTWGWRVPFVISAVLVGIAVYIQLKLEEGPAFLHLQEMRKQQETKRIAELAAQRGQDPAQVAAEEAAIMRPSPVLECIKTYPKEILLAAGSYLAPQVTFYILISFLVAYGTNATGLGLSRDTMLTAVMISAMTMPPALVLAAALSDRVGRRGVYMAGAILLGIWCFFVFPLMETRSFWLIVAALSGGQILICVMIGPQPAMFAELFSTRVRYSGASLGYQIGGIVGGGLAPLIATSLLVKFGTPYAISLYIAVVCAITVACVYYLKENYRVDLDDNG